MTIGDWADTSDFWPTDHATIFSEIKANSMFLNAWRLMKAGERVPGEFRSTSSFPVGGMMMDLDHKYVVWLNDISSCDAMLIREKIKTNATVGGTVAVEVTAQQYPAGATLIASSVLAADEYKDDFIWVTIADVPIETWAAGCWLINVHLHASGTWGTGINDTVYMRGGNLTLYARHTP